jgi:hypothetical protein
MALGDRIGQLRKEAVRSQAKLGGEIDDIPAASRSPRDQTRPGLTKDRASLPLTSPTTAAYKAGAQPRPGGRGCSGPVAISSGLGTRRGGEGRLEGGESRRKRASGTSRGRPRPERPGAPQALVMNDAATRAVPEVGLKHNLY